MEVLQKTLDKVIQESFNTKKIIAQIITKKLKEVGIVLSNEQQHKLENEINITENIDNFSFQVDEKEALEYPSNLKDQLDKSISITIDSEKDLQDIYDKIQNIVENIIPKIASEAAEIIFKTLKKSFKGFHKYHRKNINAFNKSLEKVWGNPIDLLEMFYYIASEAGDAFNNQFRSIAAKEKDFVFDVLTRLHARSCQISAEIISLLKNGFADGAHARWRTLHEIAVTAYFVVSHGNETAERYICHEAIESYKAAIKYQEYCEVLGYQKLTEEELSEIKEKYDYFVKKYGISFKNSYGWASVAIGKDNPSFADIEDDVGLEYMRPYYKMASHNVHANPKGVFFKLGLIPESGDVLLTGPSNLGLADPGHCTANSLLKITTNLLTFKPNLDRLVICNILISLEKEIGEAFLHVELELKENKVT